MLHSRATALLAAVLSVTLCACASASTSAALATVVPFSALTKTPAAVAQLGKQPVVLVFEPGEHVPVQFTLESKVMSTATTPTQFEVIASRRLYLLIEPNGRLRLSLDGNNFAEHPKNTFRFGFSVTPEQAHIDIGVGIRTAASE